MNHFLFSFLIFLIVSLIFAMYYFFVVVHKPILRYTKNEFHQGIIANCPALTQPYYSTFWCFNNHLMLLYLLFKEYKSKDYQYDLVEQLKMRDGGITGLAWSGINEHTSSKDTPIVVIFHTISGDEQDVKNIVKYIRDSLNWIAVVCIRRGHGNLPLLKPIINTMGSTSDLTRQLNYIQKKFPKAPLLGVGISAGSGILARYLGEAGLKSKFIASVAISPAYDIEKAFHRIHPAYNKIMGQRLINYFLKTHYESLSKVNGFHHAMTSKTLGELQDRLHSIAGFNSKEDYYHHSNPINVVHNIKTPLLILNSEDDPICVNLNVIENIHWLEKLPHTLLVHTKRGSHIAFFEGVFANSWSDKVMGQYFKAILSSQKSTNRNNDRKKGKVHYA